MMARALFLLLTTALGSATAPAADLETRTARLVPGAGADIVVFDVENRSGDVRSLVGVHRGGASGILEIKGRSGWEPVQALKIPGHAELRMDAERGPRVRLPPAPPGSAPGGLSITFDDGSKRTIVPKP